jgi:oligopeptidase B
MLPDVILDVTENLTWADDNSTLFYAKQDLKTLRAYQIYRHRVGSSPETDQLVFEESDETYVAYVYKTKSKKYLMIVSAQTLSQEYRYLEADEPFAEFKIFLPRQREHEYSIDHFADRFVIRTNDQAKNFRLMVTPVETIGKEHWQEIVPHRQDVYLVLEERNRGLTQIRVIPWSGGQGYYLPFDEPAYRANIGVNPEFDTTALRYEYTSMKTPLSTYDYDMVTHQRTLLKQEQVLGGFDSSNYDSERLLATAPDGSTVTAPMAPVSILHFLRRA